MLNILYIIAEKQGINPIFELLRGNWIEIYKYRAYGDNSSRVPECRQWLRRVKIAGKGGLFRKNYFYSVFYYTKCRIYVSFI